jgi:putative CocE/NonD family hydrolase
MSSDVTLHPDLSIPVGDETVAASRYEPDTEGPEPVVLITTPYRKDDRITFGSWDPSIRYLCRHGYEVVVADLPGTGASTGGDKRPFHREEGPQIETVIEWLADRPWTTGAVGTYGLSYGAWTQYAAAAESPEALRAIVPVAVANSVYDSSCTGGVFNPLKRATWPVTMQTMRALPPSRRDDEGRWAEVWHDRLDAIADTEPWLFRFLAHERHDGFWDGREVDPSEIDVPTLAACGYRDAHTASMVDFFDAIDAPKRMVLGPWRHTMPEQGRAAAVDFRRQAVAWFDRFLRGEDNGATDRPRVSYWTERDGGWTPGAGTWRGTDRWPTVDRAPTLSYAVTDAGLRPTESFEADQAVDRTHRPDHTVGVESLDRVGSVTNAGVPANADDARSFAVETDPLSSAVEWTGTGRARLRIRPTTADPLLAVRVLDVDPTGAARGVANGHLRASHRDGHDDPVPLDTGEVTAVDVPLKPKSHVFEPGHRMRVAVSGAFFPRALPPRESGPFDVVSTPSAPSSVTFPGRVHDDVAFDDETPMCGPDTAVPVTSTFSTPRRSRWGVDRDHTADAATLSTETASTVELPHGPELRREATVEARAEADDPSAASLRIETAAELAFEAETVRSVSVARTSRDVATVTTTVTVDGDTVFDRTWRRPNPLD